MARQRKRRWRWLALGLLVSWNCVGVQRPTRLTVGGDASLGEARRVITGCDGEVLGRERYRQGTLSAYARFEHASGGLAMARLRAVAGALVEASGDSDTDPSDVPRHYGLGALGLAGGYDSKYVGGDLGGTVLVNGDLVDLWPYAQVRIGDLDQIWFAATLGSMDAAFHARVLGLGLGARSERFRLYGGVVSTGMIVDNGADGQEDLTLTDPEIGAELDLQLLPFESDTVSVDIGAVLSNHLAARLGLSLLF